VVVIEAHRFGDRDIIDPAHLFEELADRALVPFLGVGVALDALVVMIPVPATVTRDERRRRQELVAGRGGMAVPPDVAV